MTDITSIRGQEHVKRALEVAACGGHNVLLTGSPGNGKTLLAQTLIDLVPLLTPAEIQDLERWFHKRGAPLPDEIARGRRPVMQGQQALAWVEMAIHGNEGELGGVQHGLLVLERHDCFAYSSLRMQRLGVVLDGIPDVQVVITQQPCPCGRYGDPQLLCSCSARLIERHHERMRALIERVPISVEVPRRDPERIMDRRVPEALEQIAGRVREGSERQKARFAGVSITRNAQMDHGQLLHFGSLEASAEKLLKVASNQLHWSARSLDGALAVARTIADLAGSQAIQANHIAEAIQYHPRLTHI